ncbi:hypothetical protein PIB30_011290 [Stylosanthes scabra]|uniref:Aminotransferase-like plant mobile domain-containing protein n=1 Tax=Stylosanthes scabra TaxID=79078 RepID=A0ABU6V6I2_9FABA|nr:hypothetical protein [Stylosanthes scabra]
MVKKATTQKDKRKKTDVQYDKGHRTRCNSSELAKTYIDLKEDKLALVHEMGFGTLVENVSNYYFSNLIMMEPADSFHIPDSTIRTNKMLKKDMPAAQYEAANAFRGKTLADLRDMVYTIKLDFEENITLFKRAFILYVQKAVLCPNNSNPLSPKILPIILDVSNTREINWGRHVYSFLLDGITESRRKNTKHIDGCVFALLIIYFQETNFGVDSELRNAQPPWLVYWKDDTLKERIRYEFKDPAGLARQIRNRTPTRKQTRQPPKLRLPQTKKQIKESNLIKSLEIEAAKGKKILGKRKQIEEEEEEEEEETDSSHYESESASDPESESESENSSDSDSDSERTVSEDEAIPEVEK